MSGLATFLEEPWRKKHDTSRKERGEGRESGRLRSRSRHRVGREVARCKTTCLFSKMTAQFSLLVFPSVFYTSTLPLLALEKASLYKDVGAACHKDTGQAAPRAPLHTEYEWRREGNNFILSIFTGRTHTHECTHSQTRSHAQARRQTRRIKTKRPPRKGAARETGCRLRAAQHTHSFLNMLSLRMCCIRIRVYRGMFMQP